MCGFVAITSPNGRSYPLDACISAINHRGPDSLGAYLSPQKDCHLGHVRLSILDLSSSGHQPMVSASGQYAISYNGEIYNFTELKSYLEKHYNHHTWKSHTDTEVILEGFAYEGSDFFRKLNGIFAFAIYDSFTHQMYVLRDPIGIKPIIYTEQEGSVFFASEIKALLAIPSLTKTIRTKSLAEGLAFMYVPEPYTMFNEFKKLIPGHLCVYKCGQLLTTKNIFTALAPTSHIKDEKKIIPLLQESFSEAVKKQLVSDVPVSLFLSGGLDSSAVAFFAKKWGANIKDAYTISFTQNDARQDAQSSDLHYAKIMAENLGLKLNIITPQKNVLSILSDIIPYMEDGFSDPAAINTYIICQAARKEGVKVMLSGQGADEYLGGYRRYLAEKWMREIPIPLKMLMSLIQYGLPKKISGFGNAFNRRLKRLTTLAGFSPSMRILGMYTWSNFSTIKDLFITTDSLDYTDDFVRFFDMYSEDHIIDSMTMLDKQYDLLSLNLCYTDRMSMAVGLEVRVPFLDFEMVKLMNSIHPSLKVFGNQGKYIFKKAMEPYLPKEIIYREKAGFGLPIRAWMKSKSDFTESLLNKNRIDKQGIYNWKNMNHVMNEQFLGKKDHSHLLFTLLVQQLWFDHYNTK